MSASFCAMNEERMPVTFEIKPSLRTIFSTFHGVATEDDLISEAIELSKHADFNPAFSHIVDFSAATSTTLTPEFLRSFAQEKSLFNRDAKQVVVAPQPHIFGLARMVQMLREARSPNIEVVRSMNEAYALLGIQPVG
jgi:hypothetical protein